MSILVHGCHYGVMESTVCFTKKNKDKIRGSMASALSAKFSCVNCNDLFLRRWKELYVYGWNIRSEWNVS